MQINIVTVLLDSLLAMGLDVFFMPIQLFYTSVSVYVALFLCFVQFRFRFTVIYFNRSYMLFLVRQSIDLCQRYAIFDKTIQNIGNAI